MILKRGDCHHQVIGCHLVNQLMRKMVSHAPSMEALSLSCISNWEVINY